jgi:hypothetical protein
MEVGFNSSQVWITSTGSEYETRWSRLKIDLLAGLGLEYAWRTT